MVTRLACFQRQATVIAALVSINLSLAGERKQRADIGKLFRILAPAFVRETVNAD